MEAIQGKDREILRALAQKQLEYAHSPKNDEILKKWQAQAEGRKESPTVRLLFSNFTHEVITPRMQCEGKEARDLEWQLLSTLVGRELFDDDTPISPTFDIRWDVRVSPFGIQPHITHPNMKNAQGYHIDPVIEDLEEEIDKLKGGSFSVNREATQERMALVQDTFGDILTPRLVMDSLTGPMTSPHCVPHGHGGLLLLHV